MVTSGHKNTNVPIWFWLSLIYPELKLQNFLFWLRAQAPILVSEIASMQILKNAYH